MALPIAFLTTLAGILLFVLVLFLLAGIRYIPNNKIGIVEKRFSGRGSVKSGIIALAGEAGFQPHMLRGGLHYLMPVQYAVHVLPLVTIPQGRIGYVFARDGQLLPPSQTLASNEKANDFQDAATFLRNGGQRARYEHVRLGMNSRLDELQAVLQWLERTPLRGLGLSHFWVVEKTS